jgi:sugar phosphate permease
MAADDLASARPPATSQTPPTRVRYGVLTYLALLSFVLYLDRVCMAQAAGPIQEELGISNFWMGFVHGSFLVAYGLFEVPTGRWGDRHGSRGVLARIVIWWSAFTVLTGMVSGLLMLLVVRFLFGAGEAGALPNAARVVARWFPAGRRGPAQGVVTTSTLIGGAVTPMLTAYLIDRTGWRWAFLLFGCVGVVWAVAFYHWYRDDPAEHASVNRAELQLLVSAPQAATPASHPPVPWRLVLARANVWLLGGVITCSAFASYLYYTWYPTYLQRARGVNNVTSGALTSMVLAGGAAGCLLGGYLGDWVVRRTGARGWTRRVLGSGGHTIAALGLLLSIQVDSPLAAALWATLSCLTANIQLANWWAAVTDVSGKHLGALFGLLNSMGVPGAFLSPVLFGWISDRLGQLGYAGREQFDPLFFLYGAVLLVGATGWLFIDATKPIAEPQPSDKRLVG